MSLRVGLDVDGVVADFHTAFRATAAAADQESGGAPPRHPLNADAVKRAWERIDRTSQWWLTLAPYEPDQIQRLYRTSRERRWEVYFLTTRLRAQVKPRSSRHSGGSSSMASHCPR